MVRLRFAIAGATGITEAKRVVAQQRPSKLASAMSLRAMIGAMAFTLQPLSVNKARVSCSPNGCATS